MDVSHIYPCLEEPTHQNAGTNSSRLLPSWLLDTM